MEQAVPVVLGWGRQGYIKGSHAGGRGRGGVLGGDKPFHSAISWCGLWTVDCGEDQQSRVVSLFISNSLLSLNLKGCKAATEGS